MNRVMNYSPVIIGANASKTHNIIDVENYKRSENIVNDSRDISRHFDCWIFFNGNLDAHTWGH